MPDATQLNGAFVIDTNSVGNITIEGSGAYSRTTIDRSVGCQNLTQKLVTVRQDGEISFHNEAAEEVLFIVSGRGDATLANRRHALLADSGMLIPPGQSCNVVNSGRNELVIVSVTSPQPGQKPASQADAILRADNKVTVHEAEERSTPAGEGRSFKLLIDPRYGCRNLTQFMGSIEKSRAPFHTHTYEEVIYILSGEGIVHVGDQSHDIKPGNCVYLSPGTPHCLENQKDEPLTLLGVFCPAGDPSSHKDQTD
ncbi:MAG: cupin domain-containing protein [SAR202 cluster bacterium]|nr:cupin domain-containing protein [SAR202 cluster bacterium]MDP6713243.1 cupin domain-containing protein [SAR202 cluster bacterium]